MMASWKIEMIQTKISFSCCKCFLYFINTDLVYLDYDMGVGLHSNNNLVEQQPLVSESY